MNTSFTTQQILDAAKASPAAVRLHDRRAWVSLFSRDSTVEDPVGSRPHHCRANDRTTGNRGKEPLERFYDTYIAPNEITFHVHNDIVTGTVVVRDLEIELRMSTGISLLVPMHLVYEMTPEDGVLKISRLRAHWELFSMISQVVAKGVPGLSTLLQMGFRTMRFQGVTGGLGFAEGFLGIHGRGKESVSRFARAVNQRDSDMVTRLLDDDFQPIGFPAGQRSLSLASFLDEVDSHFSVTKLISSGYFTSFTFHEGFGEPRRRGVGIFEFHRRTKKIRSAQFYWS